MSYDDRSVKPMSASLMRAEATRILAGLYKGVPTMLTSAIPLMVELASAQRILDPFTIGISPAWCTGVEGARLVEPGSSISFGSIGRALVFRCSTCDGLTSASRI